MKRVFWLAVAATGAAIAEPNWLEGVDLKPTYNGGVGLILEHRCVRCHRPGEIAPMPFTNYDETRSWLEKSYTPVEALVSARGMPPWPADPEVGQFANSLMLTKREIDTIVNWVDLGMPRGSGEFASDIERVEGWNIGEPDAVFELPQYTVGEDVEGEYKTFTIATDYPEDRWIVAAEARPGDPSLVRAIDAGPLGAYQPGNTFVVHPDGYGRLLKAGETVTVRVHYVKDAGYALTEQSKLGVKFAKQDKPLKTIEVRRMNAEPFTIPAGAENVEVKVAFTFTQPSEILSLMPVMHARGASISYIARMPDGTEKPLLSIPRWDPNWKFRYQLDEPVAVPKGTVVELRGVFDNSESNLKNPNPEVDVESGAAGETLEGWIGFVLSDEAD